MNLEKLSELLCFQCGKLYESITKPDDEAILVPVLGACLHSICILCATGLESPNSCPICENPEAFGNIISNCTALQNHQLIKNKLEKDFEGSGTKIRNCSSCKEVSENLQFCITCAQSQDILKQPSNNGKWIAVPLRKDLSIICLSCGVLEHKEHELAPIDMLENLEDIALLLTISSFISHSKTGLEEIVEYFENVEIQIFNCKEGFKNWRTPEFHECQLDSYKKNFVSEIEEMTKEKVKLRRRKFEFQEKRAEDIIFSLEKALIQYSGQPEASCRLRFALEKLKGLTENFSENFTTLDPEEILRIDSEINRRMHELEHSEREKSFIKSEEVGGFFKYRAIAQEIQDSEAELKNLKSQRDDLNEKVTSNCARHTTFLESLRNSDEILKTDKKSLSQTQFENRAAFIDTFYEIILMDQSAEKFEIDKLTMLVNKCLMRKQYVELMILKFFPVNEKNTVDFFGLLKNFQAELFAK